MNFHELRLIVAQIKKNITCPGCESSYSDENIEIIGNIGCDQHFFHGNCHKCGAESVINVAIHDSDDHETLPLLAKLGSAPRMEQITSNEVLDMHNFLKSFEGDFITMFHSKEKT